MTTPRSDVVIRRATVSDISTIAEFNARLAFETEALELDRDRLQAGVDAALRDPHKGVYWLAEAPPHGVPASAGGGAETGQDLRSSQTVSTGHAGPPEGGTPYVVGQLLITYEWSDWRNGVVWWIQSVYVHQDWRARGVFTTLFQFVHEQARLDPEVCGIRLYVEKGNERARRSYERLGLHPTHYDLYEMDFRIKR